MAMARAQAGNTVSKGPRRDAQAMAQRAMRFVHALSVLPSGDNPLGDIPLDLSLATLTSKRRLYTHRVRIRPDTARLLRPDYVSGEQLEAINNDPAAVNEGVGAAQVAEILATLSGNGNRADQRPVRYCFNGHASLKLLRHFVWREGHNWRLTEGKTRVVDIGHAITALAALARVTGQPKLLPAQFHDFDRIATRYDESSLCRGYGVKTNEDASPAKDLFYLAFAARQADFAASSKSSVALRALGSMIEHLEALAGVPQDASAVSVSSLRARRLITPIPLNAELSHEDVGLLWHDGSWVPVVQPDYGQNGGAKASFYSLPEGERISRLRSVSVPMVRLDWLTPPDARWDEDADTRLRRLCKIRSGAFRFADLAAAFHRDAARWRTPEGPAPESRLAKPNPWTQIHDGRADDEHYAAARECINALHTRDGEGFAAAMENLKTIENRTEGRARAASATLRKNLRLAGSRSDLINDSRKAWLQQMALQADPDGWPDGRSPINDNGLASLMIGEEATGKHNRVAISHRVAVGISAAPAAMAAVRAAPETRYANG